VACTSAVAVMPIFEAFEEATAIDCELPKIEIGSLLRSNGSHWRCCPSERTETLASHLT
jgi:hypothetical protein